MTRPGQLVMRSLPGVAVVVAAALLMAGCGSDSSAPPASASWADGVCSSVNTWKTSVVAAAGSVVSNGLSKESLQSATDQAKTATDTLESELDDLGKPDTAGGAEAKATVDQLSSQLKTGVDSIKSTVDGVSGLGGVVNAASSIRATLTTMQAQVSTAVTTLKQTDAGGELVTSFQQSAACQQLASSTPAAT